MDAELLTVDGKPVLRLERRLKHSPAKVWRAITDPAELKNWFPAEVSFDGKKMRFTFPDEAPVDDITQGEVLVFEEPRVFAFRWSTDVLRFEIIPDGDGCVLKLTQILGDDGLTAARNAIGWDVCLDALKSTLDGQAVTEPTDYLAPMEHYIEKFGLGKGTVVRNGIRFERDLMWKPVPDMWALLIEDSEPTKGGEPPVRATNPHVTPGCVTKVDAPHVLEYKSKEGTVRWEFVHDPASGTKVVLTQQVSSPVELPVLLAAWQVHLELFFAATFGVIRCPWPEERVNQLADQYRDR